MKWNHERGKGRYELLFFSSVVVKKISHLIVQIK